MSKKSITLHVIFEALEAVKLDPNELYILFCIKEKRESKITNLFLSLRKLQQDDFIIQKEPTNGYLLEQYALTNKAERLFEEIGYSKVKSLEEIPLEKAEEYNELFPKRKAGSGSYMRSNPKDVKEALKWFVKTYPYDWTTIIEATSRYLDAEEAKDFKYTSTSRYFIKKMDASKTITSKLADWCEIVKNGEEIIHRPNFTDKAT